MKKHLIENRSEILYSAVIGICIAGILACFAVMLTGCTPEDAGTVDTTGIVQEGEGDGDELDIDIRVPKTKTKITSKPYRAPAAKPYRAPAAKPARRK